MTEIEVKILEINREEMEKKLKALGAKKSGMKSWKLSFISPETNGEKEMA